MNQLNSLIEAGEDAVVVSTCDKTLVTHSKSLDHNAEYCEQNNILCYDILSHVSQCTVLTNEDVCVVAIHKHNNPIQNFLKDLCLYFRSKGLKSVLVNNSLVIGKNKIVQLYNNQRISVKSNVRYSMLQIMINNNPEAVNNICKSHSHMQQGALSEYGVTTDEILKVIDDLLNKNKKD